MKKTKRATRSRSVRQVKKHEAAGLSSLIWVVIVLVIAGAIGWYAYKQTGVGGASADVGMNQALGEVKVITSSSEPLLVGKPVSFYATAYDANGRAMEGAKFTWSTYPGNGNLAIASGADRSALVTATSVANGGGYASILVDATYNGMTVHGGKVVTIDPSRKIKSATLQPAVSVLAAGQSRTISAASLDQENKAFSSGVTYSWLIVNHSAYGSFDPNKDVRTATGPQVTVRASQVPAAGGWFNVIMTATYNGENKYAGSVVWAQPAPVLSNVVISPTMATAGSGKVFYFAATATDATGNVIKDAAFSWKAVLSGVKVEIVQTYFDPKTGKAGAQIKATLPAGLKGASIPVSATATKNGIAKTSIATLNVHP